MKCLFIKEGLKTGGTTSSFLNLLTALSKDTVHQFDVWINDADAYDLSVIPEGIDIVYLPSLQRAFSLPKERFGRAIELIRDGQLFETIYSRHNNFDKDKLIPSVQKQSLARAKHKARIDLLHYDVVISWEEFFPCYLLAERVRAKHKIAWIHPDYKGCGFRKELDREPFSKLNAVVAVSDSSKKSLEESFPDYKEKFWGIRNCINYKKICELSTKKPSDMIIGEETSLVTVARIQNISKALDRAIRIAERLKANNLKFKWYVIGGGEDLNAMVSLSKQRGVQDRIFFLGERKNPYGYIRYADIFVMQSYYEGCPMAVDESLALKTPVIASNYQAAREQVDEKYGMIVNNDEESIFRTLQEVLLNPEIVARWKKNLESVDLLGFDDYQPFINLIERVCRC